MRHAIVNSVHRVFLACLLVSVFASVAGCATDSTPIPVDRGTEARGRGSCGLNQPGERSIEAQITAVIEAEGTFVVEQNIDALMALWYAGGQVVDAGNSPQNVTDDQTWEGTEAIRHRYLYWVFPSAPTDVRPQDLSIEIAGNSALVTSTTHVNGEVSPAGDLWELQEIDGCWLLSGLTFNREQ